MTEREARSPYQYDPWNDSDLESDLEDEMGHDDLDDEVLFGSLRGNIVGIQYYSGTVNINEMVALEREPLNNYDQNAIKVVNVVRQQVGHIKRELASALAPIMDSSWARLEGIVPFGSQNQYSMPVDISLWGKPEHKQATITRLAQSGFKMKVAPDPVGGTFGGPSTSMMYGVVSNKRTFLTPSEVRNELDKLFESLNEGDKTTTVEPAEAISSTMYKHQKQALHWMIKRENGDQLPPFWENKNGQYFNSLTIFTTKTKPRSVCGGILADDMGFGKTLQTIALIMTNFKDGKPLAVPVPGKIRQSKILRMQQKAQRMEEYKSSPCKSRKSFVIKGDPNEMIDEGKPCVGQKRKTLGKLLRYNNAVDNLSSDEESEDLVEEEEEDCEDVNDDKIMLKKDDPEFKLSKDTLKQEKIASPIASRRPRRSVKKRYTYSSDDEDQDRVGSPTKRVEELPDIPVSTCSTPGTSKCGKFSGRTPTTGARATLIVCPLSVMSNWLDQLEEHIHENIPVDIYTYYGPSKIRDPAVLAKQDVVLTTYSTLSFDAKNDQALQKVKWLRVVLDEGHAIRNPNAQQTKAIYSLQAERKWVLTGTPIQNSIKDLWSLVNFLQISPFTDRQWWTRAIERPLEKGNESAIKRVQHLMGAIAMRRTKNQMVDGKPIVELPERNVYVEHVKLSEEERSLYDAMQNKGKLIVSRYFEQGTLLHHYGNVLAILMRLRQMCCHPLLIAKAAAAMKDIMIEAEASGGMNDALRQKLVDTLMMVLSSGSDEECAICLDSLKRPIITRCAHVFCRGCIEAVIKNETATARCPLCRVDVSIDSLIEVPAEQARQPSVAEAATEGDWKSSTKVDALMNGLVKLREENPRIKSLVVSQFTSLLTLLEIPLKALGFHFVRLDGTMSMKQRMRSVEEFSNPAPGSPTIMLLSLKAGGVGINLVAASRVFLMDPAWNPASEEQCFDRCHRLGQTKDVIITKFVVKDSVEERMMALQDQKRKLMQGAFGQKQTADDKQTNRIRDIKTLMDL